MDVSTNLIKVIITVQYIHIVPFPSPGDLPNPGIKPRSPTLHADSLPAESPGKSTIFQATLYYTEMKSLGHVRLFATPWTVAYQVPPSMEFSR